MTSISSSFAFQTMMRKSLLDIQRELADAQQELTTGRRANLSVFAGPDVGRSALLGQSLADIRVITDTNKRVSARLDTSNVALTSLKSAATDLRTDLLRALTDGQNLGTLKQKATQALGSLITTMNSTLGGEYLFSGANVDAAALHPFTTDPPSAAKASIDAAFLTAFGIPQDNPAVGAIPADAMESFLSGAWADQFSATSWKSDWSSASDSPLKARISLFKTIDASVTANDPALRNLAMGYSALSQLSLDNLAPATARVLLNSALDKIDAAISGVTALQQKVGGMQASVGSETDTLLLQQDYLLQHIDAIEAVDPTETAARVNSLMTQLETAYTLTAKLQQLSLTRYL